jgi:hypothetical protein
MNIMRTASNPLTLGLCVLAVASSGPSLARSGKPADGPPAAVPDQKKLTADEARRADQLDQEIDKDLQSDRWSEAIAKAEELFALRAKAQGPKHFEAVNANWQLKTLRRVATMAPEDRAAYRSARTASKHAETMFTQANYTEAQPLLEKSLETYRRILGEDHPETARGYKALLATEWVLSHPGGR